jgi:hypothetical protein
MECIESLRRHWWDRHLKLSQNAGTGGNRATALTLTLSLSQGARGLFSAPGRLPLPLREGWGEGSSNMAIPNRGTIVGARRVLRQFQMPVPPEKARGLVAEVDL